MPALIRVELSDREVRAALERLHARLRDMKSFLKNAGEILVEGTEKRFESQTDPEGNPWRRPPPTRGRGLKRFI